MLGVAGSKTITVPNGEERFYLKLADTTGRTKSKATVTGLRIPHVTSEFPMLQLQQAWDELQAEAWRRDKWFNLPKVDAGIGGTGVDVINGIKYLKHYTVKRARIICLMKMHPGSGPGTSSRKCSMTPIYFA